MTDEYIRKADAIDEVNHALDRETILFSFVRKVAISALKKIAPADVAPVIHSRWIKTADGAECENCGREAVYQIVDDHWEYEPWCPHCGARMKEKQP